MPLVNPTGGAVRATDLFGSGSFGASRDGGLRTHKGVDLIAVPGQVVVAPCACWVVRVVRPYGNGALYDVGVVLEGREAEWNYVQFRLFYVDPSYSLVMAHHPRRAGEPLGIAVSLDSRYRGITEHVHFEVIKDGALLDPTPLLFPGGASA